MNILASKDLRFTKRMELFFYLLVHSHYDRQKCGDPVTAKLPFPLPISLQWTFIIGSVLIMVLYDRIEAFLITVTGCPGFSADMHMVLFKIQIIFTPMSVIRVNLHLCMCSFVLINFDQEDTRQLDGACSRKPLNSKHSALFIYFVIIQAPFTIHNWVKMFQTCANIHTTTTKCI
jgi:hypothetical protein